MANELIDTDVLIELLRNKPDAERYFSELISPSVSAVTIAELFAGVRAGAEEISLGNLVKRLIVFEVTREIAEKGGLYRRDYGGSHGVGLNDAIFAATAEIESKRLVTFNNKHFPMLKDVLVPYQRN